MNRTFQNIENIGLKKILNKSSLGQIFQNDIVYKREI